MKKLNILLEFLNKIGLETIFSNDNNLFEKTFLKNVSIKNGVLFVNNKTKTSNLLHEAGHLAVLHPDYRKLVNNNLSTILKKAITEIDFMQECNAKYGYCEEVCATAWAYAVGVYLEFKEKDIIEKLQYQNAGNDIFFDLENKTYIGIKQLQYAGFCVQYESAKQLTQFADLPVYPQLKTFLQT
jgi:hypothetical protein